MQLFVLNEIFPPRIEYLVPAAYVPVSYRVEQAIGLHSLCDFCMPGQYMSTLHLYLPSTLNHHHPHVNSLEQNATNA